MSDGERIRPFLPLLERIAGGDLSLRLPVSGAHDDVDALAYAVNVLVGELDFTLGRLRAAKEQAESASRAKTRFLRNVSHELRTPVSAILILNDLLQSADLDDERRRELHARLRSNGRHLSGLIEALLDVSSIESDTFVCNAQRMAARQAIAAVVGDLAAEAQRSGARVIVDAPEALDDEVISDGKRVRQILATLLAGALERCPGGEIRVQLLRDAGGRLAIDIADGAVRAGEGDPLAWTLAQRLARAIGGELALAGGALRLTLEGATPPAIAAAPEQPLHGRRILVAEDNADIRDATVWLLRRFGADARGARDGQEALELAARECFDVILMDVRMPRLDGLEATRRLRAQGVRTPIVALTADAVGEQPEECLAAGCTTHLSKPLDTEQLIALVGKSP